MCPRGARFAPPNGHVPVARRSRSLVVLCAPQRRKWVPHWIGDVPVAPGRAFCARRDVPIAPRYVPHAKGDVPNERGRHFLPQGMSPLAAGTLPLAQEAFSTRECASRPLPAEMRPYHEVNNERRPDSRPSSVTNEPRSPKRGVRRFEAEEAVGWSVGRQLLEPGQGPPRSQPETQVPLRPDAIDRTVRPTDRAPPPLSTETPLGERAPRS